MRIKMQCPDCGKWFTLQLSVKEAEGNHAPAATVGSDTAGHTASGSSQTSATRKSGGHPRRALRAAWLIRMAPVLVVAALVLLWFFAIGPAIERSRTGAVEESAAAPVGHEDAAGSDVVQGAPAARDDAVLSEAPVAAPAEPAAPVLDLTLAATERCWVRVTSDGRVVSDLTLAAGERRTWKADSYFEVDVGSGEDVQVRLNGEYLGLAGIGPRVVEGLRITADGLQRDE